MKRETILKIMLVLIIGVVLCTIPAIVFAATSNSTDLDDFLNNNNFEDQGSKNDLVGNTNTNTNINTSNNTNTNVTNNTTKTNVNNYNTNLPKAGAPENTMMGVAITSLVIIAIYAYKKVREYKNI